MVIKINSKELRNQLTSWKHEYRELEKRHLKTGEMLVKEIKRRKELYHQLTEAKDENQALSEALAFVIEENNKLKEAFTFLSGSYCPRDIGVGDNLCKKDKDNISCIDCFVNNLTAR